MDREYTPIFIILYRQSWHYCSFHHFLCGNPYQRDSPCILVKPVISKKYGTDKLCRNKENLYKKGVNFYLYHSESLLHECYNRVNSHLRFFVKL